MNTSFGFPEDDYTPHGYLRNPGHGCFYGMASSCVRSIESCGFRWGLGAGRNGSIRVGAVIAGKCFLLPEDFDSAGVDLVSHHHTLNLISFDWTCQGVTIKAEFLVPHKDAIGCRVTVVGASVPIELLLVNHADRVKGFGYSQWHGCPEDVGIYSDEGPWFVSAATRRADWWALSKQPADQLCRSAISRDAPGMQERLCSNHLSPANDFADVSAVQLYRLGALARGQTREMSAVLVRSATYQEGKDEVRRLLPTISRLASQRRAADEAWWRNAPRISGDWPDSWRRSFVYDLDTTLHVLMPPMGIFENPWPSWMLYNPRIVMAENCLDMMRLHYADPDAAEQAVLTMFETAPMPNVPCMHPNGNLNMVARDGEPTGTSPAWCLPFHNIRLMYLRRLNKAWIAKLFPYMAAYMKWWLENRTDEEGWAVYKCTWEAGEDANPRLDAEHSGDAVLTEIVRPCELQAAFAHSAHVLAFFAEELGMPEEIRDEWLKVYENYRDRTRRMWDAKAERFRDWDKVAKAWTAPRDGVSEADIRFSPLSHSIPLYGVASAEQAAAMGKHLHEYADTRADNWASWSFALLEGSIASEAAPTAAEYAHSILSRVYPGNDRRKLTPPRPLPGVGHEVWGRDPSDGGHEVYGWGCTTAQILIRHLLGFQESADTSAVVFDLAPSVPRGLSETGKTYAIDNIHYRGVGFNLRYTIASDSELDTKIEWHKGRKCKVAGDGVANVANADGATTFRIRNCTRCQVRVE